MITSIIGAANDALLKGDFETALRGYATLFGQTGQEDDLLFNLTVARNRYRRARHIERPRIAVCGWEMGHNAAGRVRTLADIHAGAGQDVGEIAMIGALFTKWGGQLWTPLSSSRMPCHLLPVGNDADFLALARDFVLKHPFDIVHLSKPRMPNILFGLFYRMFWDARVILDIDDEELGVVRAESPLDPTQIPRLADGGPDWSDITGKAWTRIAVGLVGLFEQRTVSNPALQARYGGLILPHARSDQAFTPSPERRRASRAAFGLPQDRTIVLFFGTARRHKGVIEIAQAVRALRRDDLSFVVAGDIPDADLAAELGAMAGPDLHLLPIQDYDRAGDVVAAADICVLLQDDASLLAQYQLPAKLIDALAGGLAVLARPVPALADLIEAGAVLPTSVATLGADLKRCLDNPQLMARLRQSGQRLFAERLSNAAQAPVIEALLESPRELLPVGQVLPQAAETLRQALTEYPRQPLPAVRAPTSPAASLPIKAPLDLQSPLRRLFSEKVTASTFFQTLCRIVPATPSESLIEKFKFGEPRLDEAARQMAQSTVKPLVSVIMPTFNRAAIIGLAIASVREQSWENWELLICDDASTDDTEAAVAGIGDPRIRYLKLSKGGAAAARNAGLAQARGEIIAYLDTDNLWHPHYLARVLSAFHNQPGKSACYASYVDYQVRGDGSVQIRSFERPRFDQEKLLEKNYIDLNGFSHRRELYDLFGGFSAALTRRQDYDLILKYTWLRDPIRLLEILALYQRNEALTQITSSMKHDESCVPIIQGNIARYLEKGLIERPVPGVKRVTILSWDLCRNHFSKPFALAEALSEQYDVKLVSFRFFEEEIFPPLQGVVPRFRTAYFQGAKFPDFFGELRKALDEIDGDVVYVVKPRMPSLGLALLANAIKGIPVILEINDLETVVSSPKEGDRHAETVLDPARARTDELTNPYSDTWSSIMDPVAKELPVLVTHNKGLDKHYGYRCLYMRNLKDESVYDPALYDREAVRRELGFGPDDRVILFGGLLRKHKGIYELVELVERLGDPSYKLLFAGSRITPDQKKLVEKFGDRIRVLPPQGREAMARINLAADLVILWLNPEVPASHYQFPYKASDAFAMGAAVIANDISDLGDLALQGYLTQVPFGDWEGMVTAIHGLFADPERLHRMRAAARRLFLRQFSYAAARGSFALAANRALTGPQGALPAARDFAARFNAFHGASTGKGKDFVALSAPGREPDPIQVLDVAQLGDFRLSDPAGVVIVMPSIDVAKARSTAGILLKRAGMKTTILIAEDTLRQGFIPTLNDVSARLDARYVVYLAEDAFPGLDWLKLAYDKLEETGKGLLAFNCGKWRGRIAAFGMVRMDWVRGLYGGAVLFPGYKSHRADNEITAIARANGQFEYLSEAVLVEYDLKKIFRVREDDASNFTKSDRELFKSRYSEAFSDLADPKALEAMRDEYIRS